MSVFVSLILRANVPSAEKKALWCLTTGRRDGGVRADADAAVGDLDVFGVSDNSGRRRVWHDRVHGRLERCL